MPESGGLPRKSRRYASLSPTQISESERSRRAHAYGHSLAEPDRTGSGQLSGTKNAVPQRGSNVRATKRQRRSVWQVLFGRGSQRSSRRSAQQQASRKDVKTASGEPPRNFFQQLKQGDRSRLTHEQAAAKLAEEQVRQAVSGRSRQLNSLSSTPTPRRGKLPPLKQTSQNQTKSGSRAIPPFQALLPAANRDQVSPSAPQREPRTHRRLAHQRQNSLGMAERLQERELKARSTATTRSRDHAARPRSRSVSAGLYAARMLILSVGLGVLVGTMLSVLDPASRLTAGASQQATKKTDSGESAKVTQTTAIASGGLSTESATAATLPKPGQELTTLKASLQTLALQSPQLTPGIFLFDLDTNAYLDINGGAAFAAASTIKVPILVAFFQDVDAGKIRLDELLTMQKELVAGGSGELQGLPVGTQLTALETVTKMITISDNTATNMVIARLGGMTALDQRFRSWGLVSTAINSVLPDLNGTNTTSPKDMALLMTRISQGELVSMRSRDRLLDIMQRTVNRSQLPQGLDKGATIAHKTGDIGGLIGDVGLIDMPNGKRYSLTVLVKRSYNDDRAYDLVQKASRTVYQYFNRAAATQDRPAVSPSTPSEPSLPRADNTPGTPDRAPSIPIDTAITQSPSLDTATR